MKFFFLKLNKEIEEIIIKLFFLKINYCFLIKPDSNH